ncbi:class I SAM-dependent methyltransferase [Candidatus Curculioniphilus buchneri]|uniref:class I SAM-dependent methyltransferase n=1 Tax=Candidatus Curculioniphilus buchneri TaxID=690594 RepID=UPI00376F2958
MKYVKNNANIISPISWNDIPCGVDYRQALEKMLKVWWPKLFGFHLLKIGALSADLDTGDCSISHQISVGLEGKDLQVMADPYHLPFANKSADSCLLAHTLSYSGDPHRLLSEVERVLIDDGWIIMTTFNPVSMLGLGKLCPILFRRQPFRSRMYTQMQLLYWLGMLNFEVLHCSYLKSLPWKLPREEFISHYFPIIGCLSIIIARKRTFPIDLMPLKSNPLARLQRMVNAV